MTFVSYAQNFEDVMLWRALKDVSQGFYIDVGAASPDDLSVTRAFYERGWRGINIDPEPSYAEALRRQRPRDVNLQMAVGATPGRAVFYRITGTGLSTFDPALAERHAEAGFPAPEKIEVEVGTLSAICRTYAPDAVHFLKIDAEGSEREVLVGTDLSKLRPWIIVIEATAPFSPERTTAKFEDLILGAGYAQCWFDGVNAWYLAAEHDGALRDAFKLPPNYFDHFVMGYFVAERTRAEAAEARLEKLYAVHLSDKARIAELEAAWHAQLRRAEAAEKVLATLQRGRTGP